MSLRAKLLCAFATLAVLPLLALSAFDYGRSVGSAHRLIADQTAQIATRIAAQAAARLEIVRGDLRLLAVNDETERLYRVRTASDAVAVAKARASTHAYLLDAWQTIGRAYAWISLRDSTGTDIDRVGIPVDSPMPNAPILSSTGPVAIIQIPIYANESESLAGSVTAAVRLDTLVPRAMLETSFGHSGYTVIADRATSRVVFDPMSRGVPRGAQALDALRSPGAVAMPAASSTVEAAYTESDSTRVATVAPISGSSLVVISAGAPQDFVGPFRRSGIVTLAVSLLMTCALAAVFVIIAARMTRPLETLTAAATEVGRGNFAPPLPPSGSDEMGRLSSAFAAMSAHIDRMMSELESSRQMAAVGSFARQIAHEIRNPLTSIKLNLQSLERDVREGVVPVGRERTLEICLTEIQRLDGVVRGVLKLGRGAASERNAVGLDEMVAQALDTVRPQLLQQGICIVHEPSAANLRLLADRERLVGMFVNLLINAGEAMPLGGTLRVRLHATGAEGRRAAKVTIADTGLGVPIENQKRIFDPFYTTKVDGSGLGLAVALRDAELHGGTIELTESGNTGTTFVVELPLSHTQDP